MDWSKIVKKSQTFQTINFGCRTNAAETNQLAQILLSFGLSPTSTNPDLILINTCAITKKGENESIRKIKFLRHQHPQAVIIATGCANLARLNNITVITNSQKHQLLSHTNSYTPKIKDKFSSSKRYILRIQSGCNHFCSYCVVPFKRSQLWSLPITDAVSQIQQAVDNGYQEAIITGINLNLYQPGLNNLLKALLNQTDITQISFGSVPLNCINGKFLKLLTTYHHRFSHYLHIPLQSGSDKILKLMNRPYTKKNIQKTIENCKLKIENLNLGTDIIVGFPGETLKDFQQTYDLCQSIGFSKIHTFRYSPRPGTAAAKLFQKLPKIKNSEKIRRSRLIRSLICQTTLPSRQTPQN